VQTIGGNHQIKESKQHPHADPGYFGLGDSFLRQLVRKITKV
jgi:hypothetical protein